MAIRSGIARSAIVVGLALALVGGTVLATGAAGSLASELRHDESAHSQQFAAAGRSIDESTMQLGRGGLVSQVPPGIRMGWAATSPATHLGDQYRLLITNGSTPQRVLVHTMIMDHTTQTNTMVVYQWLSLAPGEQRELTAMNEYGTANHFSTRIGSQNQDLKLQVTLTDASGDETARFDQGAFWVRTTADLDRRRMEGQPQSVPHMHP